MTDVTTDPEAIARRVMDAQARFQASLSLPLGSVEQFYAALSIVDAARAARAASARLRADGTNGTVEVDNV